MWLLEMFSKKKIQLEFFLDCPIIVIFLFSSHLLNFSLGYETICSWSTFISI